MLDRDPGLSGTRLARLVPRQYRVRYAGEVRHPGSYDLAVAVSGFDEDDVTYDVGLFDADRRLGSALVTAPRGDLPAAVLHGLARS